MTSRQISRSDRNLLDAIRNGEIQQPSLMHWNDWQRWRKYVGMRPTVAVDGSNTSTAQESALWKSTMLELYGTEWAIDLASHKDVTEEEPPGVLMTAGTLPASVTSLEPSAAASDPVTAAGPSPARSFHEFLEELEELATPRPRRVKR
jgi:hypothetical protein